jgi:carbon-monoxide dehydrogenase iron sulfur subunit
MTTCSMVNEGYASLSAARVQVVLSPFGGRHQILICRQCPRAACVEVCPEECISRRPDGCLEIDYGRCTGCQACVEACPLDAICWNPISGQVIKCELCGGEPQCAPICPTGALVFDAGDKT